MVLIMRYIPISDSTQPHIWQNLFKRLITNILKVHTVLLYVRPDLYLLLDLRNCRTSKIEIRSHRFQATSLYSLNYKRGYLREMWNSSRAGWPFIILPSVLEKSLLHSYFKSWSGNKRKPLEFSTTTNWTINCSRKWILQSFRNFDFHFFINYFFFTIFHKRKYNVLAFVSWTDLSTRPL